MPAAPKISIIMTVYNAREYLPAAVRSVLAQTLPDFELLLVDDGSPNGCGEVCDELARTDPRIRVFHKPNGGPASARNTGLDNARGDYVGFVDCDDLIEPNMYATLLNALQSSGVRIAACAADAIDEHGQTIPGRVSTMRAGGVRDAMEMLLETFQTGSFYALMCCNKLFDRRLFEERHVRFDETMYFGDDASVLHLVYEGEQAVCLTETPYHYRTRTGQITGDLFPPRKLNDLRMYWDWVQYFAARPNRGDYAEWALAYYWKVLYTFWCLSVQAGNLDELRPGFMVHKKNLQNALPALLKNPHVPKFEKFRAVLFCLDPDLAYKLAEIWGHLAGQSS